MGNSINMPDAPQFWVFDPSEEGLVICIDVAKRNNESEMVPVFGRIIKEYKDRYNELDGLVLHRNDQTNVWELRNKKELIEGWEQEILNLYNKRTS